MGKLVPLRIPSDQRVLAYAAGLVDGEGCISIDRSGASFGVRVRIANTDIRMMRWLQEQFGGGTVNGGKSPSRSENARPGFCWQLGSKQTEQFLRAIRPYLILKSEQADVALAMRETMHKGRALGYPRGKAPVTEEMTLYRQSLKDQLTELNRRGIAEA